MFTDDLARVPPAERPTAAPDPSGASFNPHLARDLGRAADEEDRWLRASDYCASARTGGPVAVAWALWQRRPVLAIAAGAVAVLNLFLLVTASLRALRRRRMLPPRRPGAAAMALRWGPPLALVAVAWMLATELAGPVERWREAARVCAPWSGDEADELGERLRQPTRMRSTVENAKRERYRAADDAMNTR